MRPAADNRAMPCYDERNRDCSEVQERANAATRAACDLAAVLRRGGSASDLRPETQAWIADHDELDRRRATQEAAAAERKRAKKIALDKLTPEERRALGL